MEHPRYLVAWLGNLAMPAVPTDRSTTSGGTAMGRTMDLVEQCRTALRDRAEETD